MLGVAVVIVPAVVLIRRSPPRLPGRRVRLAWPQAHRGVILHFDHAAPHDHNQ